MGVITYSPLAGGWLSGKYRKGQEVSGPGSAEHLDTYLAADGIDPSSDVLDRIDQIVPPAVTVNVADNMWNTGTTALEAAFRRR
jgi:aryl-alcohol dehydrogenase-like predicted oxidoreductase